MEERLRNFIRDHEHAEKLVAEAGEEGGGVLPQDSIAIVRFVHHQVIFCKIIPLFNVPCFNTRCWKWPGTV